MMNVVFEVVKANGGTAAKYMVKGLGTAAAFGVAEFAKLALKDEVKMIYKNVTKK